MRCVVSVCVLLEDRCYHKSHGSKHSLYTTHRSIKCGAGHVVIPENSVSEAVVRKIREAV